ncbi:MAG: hypothetical protein ACE5FH_08430 [Candidatus Zixiibacteriota bacterium]
MEVPGRITRQVLLFSLSVLIVPMILFPEQLGTSLARASLLNAVYELVFYGIVIFFFDRTRTLAQLVQSAAMCLVYRLALGGSFGLLIAGAYSMNIVISTTFGMSSYLPAILLHIAVTPFILRPVLVPEQRMRRQFPAQKAGTQHSNERFEAGMTSIAASKAKGFTGEPAVTAMPKGASPSLDSSALKGSKTDIEKTEQIGLSAADANGFDKVTSYVGEHSSVNLAAIIDHEGLLMSHFQRGPVPSEDIAPYGLALLQQSETVTFRAGWGAVERVDHELLGHRVVAARVGELVLVVIAERQSDDLLNIRIRKALEMTARYMAERYGPQVNENTEKSYV